MKSEVNISGNRLQITRIFDAPRQLVFAWWATEKLDSLVVNQAFVMTR